MISSTERVGLEDVSIIIIRMSQHQTKMTHHLTANNFA